ncbi:MAG: transposase domain-containing protein [Acidobacteria bacterium]|nr:transposase domain-containing protein [Acidobacteriota bacterium]
MAIPRLRDVMLGSGRRARDGEGIFVDQNLPAKPVDGRASFEIHPQNCRIESPPASARSTIRDHPSRLAAISACFRADLMNPVCARLSPPGKMGSQDGHGELAIDNNGAERSLRGTAVGRRNWTFFGSDTGGKTASVLTSFIATCQRVKIDPFGCLRDVLGRIAGHPVNKLDELLPANWKPAQA